MRWLKRDKWKSDLVIISVVFLAALLLVVPALLGWGHQTAPSGQATGTIQATSTVDATAVAQDQLKQQDEKSQRENSGLWPYWLTISGSIGTILLAAAAIVSTIIGFSQWRRNRNDERKKEIAAQDKDLKDKAEERFKTAVTALGDEKEGARVGGAILLRSFLDEDDKKIYGQYYTQIFDLAVAYLRLSGTTQPLSQALIVAFKEAFPLARERIREQSPQKSFEPPMLDARGIQLDNAFLRDANLESCSLVRSSFRQANLRNAHLKEANLKEANLSKAILEGANLSRANLSGANLLGAYLEDALSLKDTNLHGVKGLTKEQLEACKAKGAIIDEDSTTSLPQSPVSPSPPSQSNHAQTPSAPPTQVSAPTPDTDESSTTSSKPALES